MKTYQNFKFILLLSFFTYHADSVLADYPIFWQRYTADPSGIEYNGRIYLFWSHDRYDPARPGYIMNDITCISTDDLKNFQDHGEVFHAGNWGAKLSWAPAVVTKNNKFYMYYGNNAGAVGVATSNNITGPYTDLGKALITGSSPGVNPPNGFWCFDPGALVDDDGTGYVYFGGGSTGLDGNSRVFKLGDDMISIVGSAVKINAPRMFEDSWIHKYNGKYYYSYCATPGSGTKIEYMMSSSPMSGFEYKGVVLPGPPQNAGNNNHHAIFQFKDKWYIAYHNRAIILGKGGTGDAVTYQRNAALDELTFKADGLINQVTPTANGLKQLINVNPYITNEAETMAKESGINTETCSEGGRAVDSIHNGDWILVKGVDFGTGAKSFDARVSSPTSGGNIEIRLGSETGTLVGTCAISGTGGYQTWATKNCKIDSLKAKGVQDLVFKFTGGSGILFNFNSYKFYGDPTLAKKEINGIEKRKTTRFKAAAANGIVMVYPLENIKTFNVSVYLPDGKLLCRQNEVAEMVSIPLTRSGNYIVTASSKGHIERYIIPFVK